MQADIFEIRRQVAAEALKVESLLEKLRRSKNIDPQELTQELEYLREKLFWICEEAELVKQMNWWQIGVRRFIPLFLTALIELGVAGVLSLYDKVIAAFSALYVFSPMVSAISGNYGLQAGAQAIRAMATGTWRGLWEELKREFGAVVFCGLGLGVSMGIIAWLTTKQFLIFPVLVCSFLAGMFTSGIMASLMPFVFKRLGFDPAFLLGPFETSLQDLISYLTFVLCLLYFSKIIP